MGTSTTVRVVRAALFGTAAVLLWIQPGSAAASEYAINACQADRTNFSTQAFDDFATRGMMWKRACDPEGPGLRGLVTSNVPRAGRVARGSRSYFVMNAPAGTRFARFTWSGQARRRDCRYALQLWASRPDGPPVPIKNVRANTRCPRRGYAQAAGWPRPHTYDINGATKIVQRIVCVGERRAPHCSSRGLNYIRTFKAQATVVDVSPPAVSVLQDNPFTQGQWVRGVQTVNYTASDNVGVKRPGRSSLALRRAEHHRASATSPHRFRASMALEPSASRQAVLVTDRSRWPWMRSTRPTIPRRPARSPFESTTPRLARWLSDVAGGPTWRNQNSFDVAWTNPPEVDRAPIAAARYQICRYRRRRLHRGEAAGRGHLHAWAISPCPAPGEWQLRVWREDAAGNHEPANASVPVPLRFDPEPPQLAFEQTVGVGSDAGFGRGDRRSIRRGSRPDRAESPGDGHLAIARDTDATRRPPAGTNRRLPPSGRGLRTSGDGLGSRVEPEQHRQTGERTSRWPHPASACADRASCRRPD